MHRRHQKPQNPVFQRGISEFYPSLHPHFLTQGSKSGAFFGVFGGFPQKVGVGAGVTSFLGVLGVYPRVGVHFLDPRVGYHFFGGFWVFPHQTPSEKWPFFRGVGKKVYPHSGVKTPKTPSWLGRQKKSRWDFFWPFDIAFLCVLLRCKAIISFFGQKSGQIWPDFWPKNEIMALQRSKTHKNAISNGQKKSQRDFFWRPSQLGVFGVFTPE